MTPSRRLTLAVVSAATAMLLLDAAFLVAAPIAAVPGWPLLGGFGVQPSQPASSSSASGST